jgi:hypothetical protein
MRGYKNAINYQRSIINQIGSGSGSRTHLNEFIPDKSGCALVEFPAINGGVDGVPPPYELACGASALLVCHDPVENWQVALVLPQAN